MRRTSQDLPDDICRKRQWESSGWFTNHVRASRTMEINNGFVPPTTATHMEWPTLQKMIPSANRISSAKREQLNVNPKAERCPRIDHRDTAFFMLNSKNLFITYIMRVYDKSIDDSDFLIMPCWTRTKSWDYSQSHPSLDYFPKRAVFVKMTKRKTSYLHLFNNLLQKTSSDAASPESHLAYECTPNVGSSEVRGGTSNKQ